MIYIYIYYVCIGDLTERRPGGNVGGVGPQGLDTAVLADALDDGPDDPGGAEAAGRRLEGYPLGEVLDNGHPAQTGR